MAALLPLGCQRTPETPDKQDPPAPKPGDGNTDGPRDTDEEVDSDGGRDTDAPADTDGAGETEVEAGATDGAETDTDGGPPTELEYWRGKPRPLDELREQLGELAEHFKLPEGHGWGTKPVPGSDARQGRWERRLPPPPNGQPPPQPPPKQLTYHVVDDIAARRTLQKPPKCDEEFIIAASVEEVFLGCAQMPWAAKFRELALRACAEAQLVCAQLQGCERGTPTQVYKIEWHCRPNDNAMLIVHFGFRCLAP